MHYIPLHRCNARCVMCGLWKETGTRRHELSPGDLAGILSDRLFSRLEYVGISGGEPFLRADLTELCGAFLGRCPTIKRLSLTTNGLLTDRMAETLPEIAGLAATKGVLVDVSVSVHGMDTTLDAVYGLDRAFARIERTVELLEKLRDDGRLSFSMNCVVLAANLADAPRLRRWARSRGIHLSFVIGEHRDRFRTDGLDDAFVADGDRQAMIGFLRKLAQDPDEPVTSAQKYLEIVSVLEGRGTRSLACYYAMGGVLLGYDGRLYYCSHSREIGSCGDRPAHDIYYDADNLQYRRSELIGSECRTCPPYTRTRWEIEKDLLRVVAGAVRKRLGGFRRRG
jgi:MoaA/NifB/PqqE/SkfB family radical SAM enzyme